MTDIKQKAIIRFNNDIKLHQMKVMLNNGLHRHIRFQSPQSNSYWFEVITWPGALTIQGDMGCWTFSRTPDMFEFFRSESGEINESYWAEKIQSNSKYGGGPREFDVDLFVDELRKAFDERINDSEFVSFKNKVWDALKEDVLYNDNEFELKQALRDFSFTAGNQKFVIEDSYEISGMQWSFHYLWCLYAIVYAIIAFDKYTEIKEESAA